MRLSRQQTLQVESQKGIEPLQILNKDCSCSSKRDQRPSCLIITGALVRKFFNAMSIFFCQHLDKVLPVEGRLALMMLHILLYNC